MILTHGEREHFAAASDASVNRSDDRRIDFILRGGRHGDERQEITGNRSSLIAGKAENFVSRIETGGECGRGGQLVVHGDHVVVQGAPQDADRGTGGGQVADDNLIGPVRLTSRLGITAKQHVVDHVDLLQAKRRAIQRLGFGRRPEGVLNFGLCRVYESGNAIRVDRATKIGQIGLFEKCLSKPCDAP